jgi:hypothetical protein
MAVNDVQPEGMVTLNFLGRRMSNGEAYVFVYTDDQAANMVRTLVWFANRPDLSFTMRDARHLSREVARISEAAIRGES